MIDRLLRSLLVITLTLCVAATCEAAKEVAKEEIKTEQQLMEEAKEMLNDTTWEIQLRQADGKSDKQEPDILRFHGNKIESDKMVSNGFMASNYTIRLKGQEKDIVIWETMQTSEKEGIAFWRGEVREEKMRGVLSWHVDDKNKKDYTFISLAKKDTTQPTEEEPVEKTEDVTGETAEVTAEEGVMEEITPAVEQQEAPQEEMAVEKEAPTAEKVEPVKKEEPKKEERKKRSWFNR